MALALTSSAALVLLDMLVVTTALAVMRSHFHVPVSELEWTVSAYTLSYTVLMMTAAAVGDRIGRRRLMLAGLALFAAASAACALVPSLGWLVAARAVQGAGSAMVMPAALALLGEAFPPTNAGSGARSLQRHHGPGHFGRPVGRGRHSAVVFVAMDFLGQRADRGGARPSGAGAPA